MIDIHSLHIGSHLLFNGERHEVTSIRDYGESYYMELDNKWRNKYSCEALSPIPITEELLTELGFEKHMEGWIKDINQDYPIFIKIKSLEDKNYVSVGGSSLFFSYLHELESFVYLTTKQRLI